MGNMQMERRHYESAIDSFERAHAQVRRYQNRMPSVVTLVISLTGRVQHAEIPHHL